MRNTVLSIGPITMMTAGLILAGCKSDDASSTTDDTIGVDGGEASGAGATVTIPSGALSSDTEIGVARVDVSDATVPDDLTLVSDTIAFTPHGTKFKKDVTLEIPYESTSAHLVLLRLDDEEDTTWESISGGQFDEGMATIDVRSFSVYAVGAEGDDVAAGGAGNSGGGGVAGATNAPGGAGGARNPTIAGAPNMAGAPATAGAPNGAGGLEGSAGAGGMTPSGGSAGASSGNGGSSSTEGFDADAYCAGTCAAQIALGCSATDYDQASCEAYCAGTITPDSPCYPQQATFDQCLLDRSDTAYECDDEGNASVIDGTCDDELNAYVTCLTG